eukprot:PITA_21577
MIEKYKDSPQIDQFVKEALSLNAQLMQQKELLCQEISQVDPYCEISDKLTSQVVNMMLEEATAKALWDKLGTLYQSKPLVNKLFLRKKLYNLRMKDGDSVTEDLNEFNTVVSQLASVDIKISDEDKCISLLCTLPDSWDSLVIAIGSNATSLQFDEIVSASLREEMRWKTMDNQNGDALSV